jgi:hypothetical protein
MPANRVTFDGGRLYEAAIFEVDQEILPRRVPVAKKAIHSQIAQHGSSGGTSGALMDALKVLDDLLRMNEADLHLI